MNLKESIELIQQTAVQAAGPQRIFQSEDKRHATYLIDGKPQVFDLGVPPRSQEVTTLDDLIRFANDHPDDGISSVWHNESAVTLLLDDDDRRERVVFPLVPSEEIQRLRSACLEPRYTQRAFVDLLYRILRIDDATVLPFRRLDFKVVSAAAGEVEHGKDRLGRSVASEVTGTSEIPEQLTVSVPLYESPGERDKYAIVCSIGLNAQASEIEFRPFPGELSRAYEDHQTSIHTRLVKELPTGFMIYQGAPGGRFGRKSHVD